MFSSGLSAILGMQELHAIIYACASVRFTPAVILALSFLWTKLFWLTVTSFLQILTHPNPVLLLHRAMAKVFKGKDVEKGVAFPTCVSINK